MVSGWVDRIEHLDADECANVFLQTGCGVRRTVKIHIKMIDLEAVAHRPAMLRWQTHHQQHRVVQAHVQHKEAEQQRRIQHLIQQIQLALKPQAVHADGSGKAHIENPKGED